MRLAILLAYGVLSVGYAEKVPSFIKKCPLTDPEVAKCVAASGNLAISALFKGSSFFSIPSATPLHISTINLPGMDFTVKLSNARLFGMENLRIKDVRVNVAAYQGAALMTAPYLNLTADYIIISKDLFFPRILETGRLHTTLAEIAIKYEAKASSIARSRRYFKLASDDLILQSKRIFYRYSNLQVNTAGNFVEFLNVHKRIIDERIRPGVSEVLRKYARLLTTNLASKLPKEIYFYR